MPGDGCQPGPRGGLACLSRSSTLTDVAARPKKKCCTSKPRCKRCPIRMLAEGRLDRKDAKVIFAKARNRKALKKAKLTKAA